MKWPWSRNKQPKVDVQVPPEVEEYYQSTHKDRRGMAWLLAFGTLILTVLIAVVLFFAGRWAYRAITGGGSSSETEQAVQEGQSGDNSNEVTEESADQETDGVVTETEESAEANNGDATESSGSETLPSGPTNSGSESGTGSNVDSTPTTGPSDIPRTGPTEE